MQPCPPSKAPSSTNQDPTCSCKLPSIVDPCIHARGAISHGYQHLLPLAITITRRATRPHLKHAFRRHGLSDPETHGVKLVADALLHRAGVDEGAAGGRHVLRCAGKGERHLVVDNG